MSWIPRLVVGLFSIYLLVSFGSWFLLSFLQWRAESSGSSSDNARTQKQALYSVLDRQNRIWPSEPRPARFAAPDTTALAALETLRETLGALSDSAKSDGLEPIILSPLDAALLRGPKALVHILAHHRSLHQTWALIAKGQTAVDQLRTQEQLIRDIPVQMRNEFNDTRAEIRRLSVLTEDLRTGGMQGLADVSAQLEKHADAVDASLESLAAQEMTPSLCQRLDSAMEDTHSAVTELDQVIAEASEIRQRAIGTARRVRSAFALASERWATLKKRGAVDSEIDQALADLEKALTSVDAMTGEITLESLKAQTAEAIGLDSRVGTLMTRLDGYDHLIRASQSAIEGLPPTIEALDALIVSGLAQDGLMAEYARASIAQARELYREAAEQRKQGTNARLEEALKAANQGQELVAAATRNLENDLNRVRQARQSLNVLSDENYASLRQNLESVAQELQSYPQYWAQVAGAAQEAMQKLDTARSLIGTLPDEEQLGTRFSQQNLDTTIATLKKALDAQQQSVDGIHQLANMLSNVRKQHQDLSTALAKLDQDTLPSLEAAAESMLPELRQRYDLFTARYNDESQLYRDSAQTEYGAALTEWLPDIKEQATSLLREHQDSVKRYRQAQREAIRKVDKLSMRLQRLEPGKTPNPDEDLAQLETDVSIWRAAMDSATDNPRELRDLVTVQTESLCRRLERAGDQIEQDRRTLDTLSREYRDLEAAILGHQQSLGSVLAESPWHLQDTDAGDAQISWDEAQRLEEQSAAAAALTEAREYLQRANATARRAEQGFAATAQRTQSAVRRLNTERQALEKAMAQARRQETAARTEQRLDDAARIQAIINSGQQAIDTALATSFSEDALRHLKSGRQALDRL